MPKCWCERNGNSVAKGFTLVKLDNRGRKYINFGQTAHLKAKVKAIEGESRRL